MSNAGPAKNGTNSKQSVLLTLASSSDRMVQLGTLAAVLVGGMGSFFQNEKLSEQSIRNRDVAVNEIHHLYARVDDFEERQMKSLKNQSEILKNQQDFLEVLREGQRQYMLRQQHEIPQYPLMPQSGQ